MFSGFGYQHFYTCSHSVSVTSYFSIDSNRFIYTIFFVQSLVNSSAIRNSGGFNSYLIPPESTTVCLQTEALSICLFVYQVKFADLRVIFPKGGGLVSATSESCTLTEDV